MPLTSRGYRFPASSDSPNIAQFFQNLATDVNNDVGSPWVVTVDSGPSGDIGITQATYTDLPGLVQSSSVVVPVGKSLEVEFSCPIALAEAGAFSYIQLVIGGTAGAAKGASNQWWQPYMRYQQAGTGAVMTYRVQGYRTPTGNGGVHALRGTGGTIRLRHRIV